MLDEMYPAPLAEALRAAGIETCPAAELGLAGRSDADLFAAAVAQGYAVLTENVADFTRIAAEQLTAGHHHPGVLTAPSSRFARRAAGRSALVTAVRNFASQHVEDCVVYLERADQD